MGATLENISSPNKGMECLKKSEPDARRMESLSLHGMESLSRYGKLEKEWTRCLTKEWTRCPGQKSGPAAPSRGGPEGCARLCRAGLRIGDCNRGNGLDNQPMQRYDRPPSASEHRMENLKNSGPAAAGVVSPWLGEHGRDRDWCTLRIRAFGHQRSRCIGTGRVALGRSVLG